VDNNLKLNRDKTKEIVFRASPKKVPPPPPPPPPLPPRPDIERVSSLRILGVIVNDKLTAADHVTTLLSSSSSLLYAMRVLRAHGTPSTRCTTFRATVVSLLQASNMRRQHGRECARLPTAPLDVANCSDTAETTSLPTIADMFNSTDDDFSPKTNSNHVLQPYLCKVGGYTFRIMVF